LRELLLNDCGLVECPHDMGAMAKLKVLNLGSNQLKVCEQLIGWLILSPVFFRLQGLAEEIYIREILLF